MLKRKIETYLADWKQSEDRKPLVIKGIRQCGKTYIVQKFARENYDSVVYMNFILEPDKKSAFTGNIDVDTIILNLSALIQGSQVMMIFAVLSSEKFLVGKHFGSAVHAYPKKRLMRVTSDTALFSPSSVSLKSWRPILAWFTVSGSNSVTCSPGWPNA